ncbi:MAG: PAS domain S-box protein, partial [Planctomycetia bacterium]|nr:PAS domain S-box protein [Planctomycetia bacterium]
VPRAPGGAVESFSTILRYIRAQKEAEVLLRAREAEQRRAAQTQGAILNALPAHIALLDRHGDIVAVNEAWQRADPSSGFLGAGLGPGQDYLAACGRDAATGTALEVARGIRAVLDCGLDGCSLEYLGGGPAEARWFWMVASPLHAGQRAGAVVAHLDITRRRLAEAELRASEERFRQLAENIRDAFWVTDVDPPRVVYASPAYEAIWGRTREQLLDDPRSWFDAIHPEDLPRVRAGYRPEPPAPFTLEYRIRRPDGSVRWVLDRGFPIRAENGAVYRFVGLAEDLTQRKQAEEALRASEERLRSLLAAIPDQIFRLDAAGSILDYKGEPGAEAEPLVGHHYRDVLPAAVGLELAAAIRAARQTQSVQTFEYDWPSHPSRLRCFEARVVATADEQTVVVARNITERREAEQALSLRDKQYRDLIETSHDLIWSVDAAGQTRFINRTACGRILGYEPDEVVGRVCMDFVHPEQRPTAWAAFERVLQGHELIAHETVYLRKDGSSVWVSVNGRAQTDETGQLVGVVVMVRDVTDARRAQEALRQSEARCRFLAENATDMISRHSLAGLVLDVSPACRRLLGFEPEELVGRGGYDFIHDDDRASVQRRQEQMLAERQPTVVSYRMRQRNGSFVWVETAGQVITPPDGTAPELVCVTRNISERKRAEERAAQLNEQLEARVLERTAALRTAEARYRGLVEQLPAITYTASLQHPYSFTYVSPQLEDIVGFSPAEWLADSALWVDQLHADDRQRVLHELAHSRATGQPFHCEYRLLPREGDVLWFRDRAKVIHDEQGRPAFLQGIMLDVTEYERERIGRERLQALSRRLVEVQEAERRAIARELHDEIGQTLTGLKLTLETAAHLPAGQQSAPLLQTQGLVNELMARVRALSLDLRPAMLDDLGLLPALLWFFERFASTTSVRVAFEHAQLERRFVPAIETAAYRIVQEALTNVARHARAPQAIVRVWAGPDLLGVQVRDAGVGFDFQDAVDQARTGGLTGMRERCTLLGGKLTVESSPAAGTCVTAELPL